MPSNAELQATIDRLSRQLEVASTQLAKATGDIQTLQDKVAGMDLLAARLSHTEEQTSTTARQSTDSTRLIAQLTTQVQQASDTATQTKAEATQTASTVATLDAKVNGLQNPAAALTDVFTRLSRVEEGQQTAAAQVAASARQQATDTDRKLASITDHLAAVTLAQTQAKAATESMISVLSTQVAAVEAKAEGGPGVYVDDALAALNGRVNGLSADQYADPVLSTAKTRLGLQIPDSAIIGVSLTKGTGTIATAQIAANAVTNPKIAADAVQTANILDANVTDAKIADLGAAKLTGDVATARLTASITAAFNTAAGKDISKATVGDLTLGAGQKAGFYGTTPPAQQAVTAVTNGLASGGSANTLVDLSLVDYNSDKTDIKNNLYQIGQQLNIIRTAIRNYGLLS